MSSKPLTQAQVDQLLKETGKIRGYTLHYLRDQNFAYYVRNDIRQKEDLAWMAYTSEVGSGDLARYIEHVMDDETTQGYIYIKKLYSEYEGDVKQHHLYKEMVKSYMSDTNTERVIETCLLIVKFNKERAQCVLDVERYKRIKKLQDDIAAQEKAKAKAEAEAAAREWENQTTKEAWSTFVDMGFESHLVFRGRPTEDVKDLFIRVFRGNDFLLDKALMGLGVI